MGFCTEDKTKKTLFLTELKQVIWLDLDMPKSLFIDSEYALPN